MAIDPPAEILRLRTALRDLVALSAIPAAWVGREPPAIAAGLADVLVGSLHLDFGFVRLCDPNGGATVEVTRGNAWKTFPEWLERRLAVVGHFSRKEIIPDIGRGAGPCRGIVIPVGVNAAGGLIAAACDRTDFPTEIDQLLLSVAANHAATAFQNSRLIYERRRAEQALRQSEQELRQARDELEMKVAERTAELRLSEAYLAEAQRLTHTGSWAWSPISLEPLYWSEEMFRIFGLDPQQGLPPSETFWERVHPEDRDSMYELMRKAVREKTEHVHDHRIVLPDGTVKHIHAIGHPVLNRAGDVVEFVGTVVDVTERKRAEEELRAAETRFRTYVDHATDALFVHDEQGNIVDVNRRACESLGYTREELIGMAPRDFDPGVDAAFMQRINERLEAGEIFAFEASHRRKDGTVFPVEVRVRPFWHGGHRFGLALARDITQRKRAEEELREAQAELAHVTRVLTLGEMTASIAHEVNQPLAGVTTNGNAGLRWLARDPANLEEARECLKRIIRDGNRASEVIARMRTFARKATPQKAPLAINDVIAEVLALADSELRRHGVALHTDLAAALPPVLGDRIQLQQVLLNLLLNGMEAMRTVTDRPRALVVRSQPEETATIRVSVQDVGTGIAPQDLERIFTAFVSTKPEGLGMGLAISRSIIEAHGGRLWATPNVGPGATVQFILPIG